MKPTSTAEVSSDLLRWINAQMASGTLPLNRFDELNARVGRLLWNVFCRDANTAGQSDGVRLILCSMGLEAEVYLAKFSLARRGGETPCGYWPKVPLEVLTDAKRLDQLRTGLERLGQEDLVK